jgi:ABC-2 type transport system permease protein
MTATTPPIDEGTSLARARDLLGAEWIKLRSLRSTYWVLLGAVLTALAIGFSITKVDVGQWPTMTPSQRAGLDPLADPYIGFMMAQLVFAALGVLTVTGEYSSGLIRTTFTAVPVRRAVLAAKAGVVTAVTIPVGAAAAVATFAIGQAILSSRHIGISITHPGALRAIVAATLYLAAAALIGIGLGVLLRHAAAALGVLVTLLFLAPQLTHGSAQWMIDLNNALPGTAIRRLVSLKPWDGAPSVTAAFAVMAIYPVVVLIAAAVVIHRRDA